MNSRNDHKRNRKNTQTDYKFRRILGLDRRPLAVYRGGGRGGKPVSDEMSGASDVEEVGDGFGDGSRESDERGTPTREADAERGDESGEEGG